MKNSVVQRQRALVLESGRGEILDRDLKPMTGKIVKALVAFPINSEYQGEPQQVNQLGPHFADEYRSLACISR